MRLLLQLRLYIPLCLKWSDLGVLSHNQIIWDTIQNKNWVRFRLTLPGVHTSVASDWPDVCLVPHGYLWAPRWRTYSGSPGEQYIPPQVLNYMLNHCGDRQSSGVRGVPGDEPACHGHITTAPPGNLVVSETKRKTMWSNSTWAQPLNENTSIIDAPKTQYFCISCNYFIQVCISSL